MGKRLSHGHICFPWQLVSVAAGDVGGEVGWGAGRPWERAPEFLAVSWAGTWGPDVTPWGICFPKSRAAL